MGNKRKELTYEERVLIYKYDTLGASKREIGRQLGRSHTTISRELKRGPSNIYRLWERVKKAELTSELRKSFRGAKSKFFDDTLANYVSEKLTLKWTPELIAGRFSKDNPGNTISSQSIYNYIYRCKPEYIKLLARKGKKRRGSAIRRARKKQKIANKTSISQRPKFIQKRKQFGHWELDTMVSRQSKAALVIATERHSRVSVITKVEANNSANFRDAVIARLRKLPSTLLRTCTYDNGSENAKHNEINIALHTKSFFCDAYCSWQKGTVENRIGKIRRFLPKGTDLRKVSPVFISQIELIINNTPMKLHNFKSPMEVLSGAINSLI